MENTTPEFETPSAPNKDMWLFLIVLDVIILCVLGFFLYKHFSARVLNPAPVTQEAAISIETETVETVDPLPEITAPTPVETKPSVAALAKYTEGMDAFNQENWPAAKAAWLEAQRLDPSYEDVKLALSKVEEKLAAPVVAAMPAKSTGDTAKAVTKQSVVVTPVNGSKYRRVTFRWFDPAEKVAIVSGFTNRQPQALKKVGDHWETTLSIAPGTYKFLYIVDGKSVADPYADQKDGRSLLVVK